MATPDRAAKPVPFTKTRQQKFLLFVERNAKASVREAAKHAGVRRWQVRELLETDATFRAAYEGARGHRRDEIREEIWARAFNRDDASSGRLLLKLAEAELPEYAPRQRVEHANADDKPFEVSAVDLAKLSPEERASLRGLFAKILGRDGS